MLSLLYKVTSLPRFDCLPYTLTPVAVKSELSYLRGKLYEAEKKSAHRPKKVASSQQEKLPQSDALSANATKARLAEQLRVGHATIERDAKFARAVDTIAEHVGVPDTHPRGQSA